MLLLIGTLYGMAIHGGMLFHCPGITYSFWLTIFEAALATQTKVY